MRIGVITYWNSSDNYGQVLQCYALQSFLRNLGHDVFLIRYAPTKKKNLRERIKEYLLHPSYIFNHLPIETKKKKQKQIEQNLKIYNQKNNHRRAFEQFREDNLKMTPHVYTSYCELKANPPTADVFITGSDQVWRNPLDSKETPAWFLSFGDTNVKRIAYAASIGRRLKKKEILIFKNFLEHFDAISVREQSAYDLCRSLNIVAQVCVDPTLLLPASFYRGFAQRPRDNEKYAFFYLLNIRNEEDLHYSMIKQYLIKENIKIKSVTATGYCQGRELIEDTRNLWATIPEWIGYIDNAKCVFTSSFHGMVFSILMHRPFLVIGLSGVLQHSNSRMEHLLRKLNISERMFNPSKSVSEQMNSFIDWDKVDRCISELRASSLLFIEKNLET